MQLSRMARGFSIVSYYTLFYYYSWLRIGRSGHMRGYQIFLHTLLEVVFLTFNELANLGLLAKFRVRQFTQTAEPVTVSRGPMARKKWSRSQLLSKSTNVLLTTAVVAQPEATYLSAHHAFAAPLRNSSRYYHFLMLLAASAPQRLYIITPHVIAVLRHVSFLRAYALSPDTNLIQLRLLRFRPTFVDYSFFFVLGLEYNI
jgi:hypothetical protein